MGHDNFKQWAQLSKQFRAMNTALANSRFQPSNSLMQHQAMMGKLSLTFSKINTSNLDLISSSIARMDRALIQNFNNPLHNSLVQYQEALSRFAVSFERYNFNYSEILADNLSNRFIELSNEVLDDFSSFDLPPEISEEISKTSEGSQAGFISFDRMIAIIALIITIISVLHDLLPDKSVQETNRKLQQLIEIQERELELMEQAAELESPEGSELPLHQPQE